MPTFAALEDFPVGLRSRLVVPSSLPRQGLGQKEQQQEALLSLETPYSLLVHDTWHYQRNLGSGRENEAVNNSNTDDPTVPMALTSSSRPMDADAIQTIRRQIAQDLHRQTACGQQQQRVMATVTGIFSSEQPHGHCPCVPTGFISVANTLAWQSSLARPVLQWRGLQDCHQHQYASDEVEGSDKYHEVVNTLLTVHNHEGNFHHHRRLGGWTWGQVYQISTEDTFSTFTTNLLLPSLMGGTATMPSVSTPQLADIAIHYIVPAYLPPITLAQSVNAVAPHLLHQIRIDTYRDDHDLAMAVAQIETTLQNNGGGQRPWWVVVLLPPLSVKSNNFTGLRFSSSSKRRWHRLVRLYHGIVVLLAPSATYETLSPIHLHLDQGGHRLTCRRHIDVDKVGRSVTLTAPSSSFMSQSP
jgi:hypothetical protein